MTKKSTEVAGLNSGLMGMLAVQKEAEANLPAHLAQSTGRGSEDVKNEDLQTPRLKLVQAISDELKPKNSAFIEEARNGDLLNSVTKQLWKGEEGILVVNLKYVKRWNVWRNRKFKNGGLVASCMSEAEAIQARNEMALAEGVPLESQERLDECYEVLETPENWCLQIDPETCEMQPLIIDLPKTKQKKAREWNTLIKQKGGDRFAGIWQVRAVDEQNNSGEDYKNFAFSFVGYVPDQLFKQVEEIFAGVDAQFTKKTGETVPESEPDVEEV